MRKPGGETGIKILNTYFFASSKFDMGINIDMKLCFDKKGVGYI